MEPGQINIKIRIAVPGEAAAVARVLYESFAAYESLYTRKAFVATTPGVAEINDRIEQGTVWIALCNNRIAGTVSILSSGEGVYIRSMAVIPPERGKGLGKALLEHVFELALTNNYPLLRLNTTTFLTEAICLYESLGFVQKGYEDLHGTPLIKMIKELDHITSNKMTKNDYAN